MTLTKQHVRDVLDTYIRAWEQQDPDLIVTIFTEVATPRPGRSGLPRPPSPGPSANAATCRVSE
jgi:hypothetical protein